MTEVSTGLEHLLDVHLLSITDDLLEQASILAEADGLRAYDAVHLAAAIGIETDVFTSADVALCAAADRHGFHVADPTAT